MSTQHTEPKVEVLSELTRRVDGTFCCTAGGCAVIYPLESTAGASTSRPLTTGSSAGTRAAE
jgi:hypothetical protein